MIVAFCGHGKIEKNRDLADRLLSTCEKLIAEEADHSVSSLFPLTRIADLPCGHIR